MTKHVFSNVCIDFTEILSETTLDKMLKTVFKQSKTELARMRVDFVNYKDYDEDEWCPAYFGMFVEWLAGHFLNHYGHLFNIQAVTMTDSVGSTVEDYGIDGQGLSVKRANINTSCRAVEPNSPVYIQVKGTLNHRKEYKPNDGNRLPNFGCNAFSEAIKHGYAYKARYVLFTTGAGIHYSMDKMFNGLVEVINHKKIKALMDDDTVFLNKLRAEVGLLEVPIPKASKDAEARINLQESKVSFNG